MAEVADWSVERVEREVGKAEAQAERTEAVGLEDKFDMTSRRIADTKKPTGVIRNAHLQPPVGTVLPQPGRCRLPRREL